MFTFHSVHLLNRSHNQHQFSSEKVLDRQIHHINCISPIYPSYYTLLTDDHMHAKWSGHHNFPHHFFYFSHLCCSQGFQIHLATSSNRIVQDFLALEYFLAALSSAPSLNCLVMTGFVRSSPSFASPLLYSFLAFAIFALVLSCSCGAITLMTLKTLSMSYQSLVSRRFIFRINFYFYDKFFNMACTQKYLKLKGSKDSKSEIMK